MAERILPCHLYLFLFFILIITCEIVILPMQLSFYWVLSYFCVGESGMSLCLQQLFIARIVGLAIGQTQPIVLVVDKRYTWIHYQK